MNVNDQHILSKEGILTTFSIAKKVNNKNIKRLQERLIKSKSNITKKKLQELLKKAIIKETNDAIQNQKIPGLILGGIINNNSNDEKKKINQLSEIAAQIARKLMSKSIIDDKYYLCFIINTLVNILELEEEDFEEFHKKFGEFIENNGEPPEPDEE